METGMYSLDRENEYVILADFRASSLPGSEEALVW